MNHHHRKTLHALFAHPVSANIDMKEEVMQIKKFLSQCGVDPEKFPV